MRDSKDAALTQRVSSKLLNHGLFSPCRVIVESKDGQVTLSGTVQYAHQIGAAVKAASGIASVRRVVDQIVVKPRIRD